MFYKIVLFILKITIIPLFRIKVHGLENVPYDDKILICSNHRSNRDPIFVGISLPKVIHFMGKREIFDVPILGSIARALNAFPVDRDGRDLSSLKKSVELLNDHKTLGVLPEGTRTKSIDRANMKEGVAYIAIRAKSNILPIEIISDYKLFHKTDIYIKKEIEIKDYLNMKSKLAMTKITDDLFLEIYKNQVDIRKSEDANNNSR